MELGWQDGPPGPPPHPQRAQAGLWTLLPGAGLCCGVKGVEPCHVNQLPSGHGGACACFPRPPAVEVSLEVPRVQGCHLGLPDEFLALRQDTSVRTHWFNQHRALAWWNSRLWPEP